MPGRVSRLLSSFDAIAPLCLPRVSFSILRLSSRSASRSVVITTAMAKTRCGERGEDLRPSSWSWCSCLVADEELDRPKREREKRPRQGEDVRRFSRAKLGSAVLGWRVFFFCFERSGESETTFCLANFPRNRRSVQTGYLRAKGLDK